MGAGGWVGSWAAEVKESDEASGGRGDLSEEEIEYSRWMGKAG